MVSSSEGVAERSSAVGRLTVARTAGNPRPDTGGSPDESDAISGSGQWNESPQAQEFCALGLSMVKPCFSMVSTKSMTAPSR